MQQVQQVPTNQTTKQELLDLLSGTRMAVLHGHFVEVLAHKMAAETGTTVAARARAGKGFSFEGDPGEFISLSLEMLADALDNPRDNRGLRGNFFLLLKRAVVCTGTELVLDYCETTRQTAALARANPWWDYARVFRHTFSHGDGSTLRQWPRKLQERGVSAVTWNGKTVRRADVGSVPEFTIVDALRLQEEMYRFVSSELR